MQAAVVVGGDFPQGVFEGDRVFFVAGDQLATWLQAQDARLPVAKAEAIAREISTLRQVVT